MLRWTIVGGLAWLWVLSAGCGDDDDPGTKLSDVTGKNPSNHGTAASGDTESIGIGGGNVGTGTGGRGGSGGGSAAGDGNGNGNAGSGNAGNGDAGDGNAGAGGADDAGAGGGGGALAGGGGLGGIPGTGGGNSGTGQCNLVCPLGTHCELADVTCIQAPCNPVPGCVPNGGSGGMGGGAAGAICGTRGAGPCPDGQFCNHPIGADCGRADAPGSCEPIPGGCTRDFQPVCGCDGATYSNACVAASEGVSVERDGEC